MGQGAARINTVEGRNQIKPHTTAQTQHSDGIERTETQCITRKNEKAHIHTRDMTQPEERDNNNTEAHQTTT